MDDSNSQRATLGCGTLILIALIVMFFSGPSVKQLEKEIKALRTDVAELKSTVDRQTQAIEALTKKAPQPPGV
jgi:type II secretory pathway component PulM